METNAELPMAVKPPRRFRLWLYLLIVFGLSWPFLLAMLFIPVSGDLTYWSSFAWSGTGMLMVTVGAFIAGRWVFRDGFRNVGWRWGSKGSWALAMGVGLLIWAVPAGLDMLTGARTLAPFKWIIVTQTLFTIVFSSIVGFGEEFGFRGYLLPRLWWLGPRRAVLVNGLIWWAWHYPLFLIPFIINAPALLAGQNLPPGVGLLPVVLLLTVFHIVRLLCLGVIFSYIWVQSGSIVVASVFHGAYDTLRNLTFFWLVGGGLAGLAPGLFDFPLPFLFELILAILFLWRGKWVLPAEVGAPLS